MAEIKEEFEDEGEKYIDESTAYERLLNQMFIVDEHLQLKTELYNPIEFSRYQFISDTIRSEGNLMEKGLLDEEADLLNKFGINYMANMVSHDRKGRGEGFKAIDSFNMGQLQVDDKEAEKFKRVIRELK